MSVIKECPWCHGNRIGCDYCDESGLMDLNEIQRIKDLEESEEEDDE